eukprot:TRINITY_DN455_c0_g1_i1.p2 TRINITY_DN455_c0_g1~~TRINITY_DN455_c0_g1_i1.p2  ORF type:complete len:198 (-),score=14.87 TRINITY_DN455_c0_g1_i1:14-607(-)
MEVNLSEIAWLKMIGHSMKHLSGDCYSLMLGSIQEGKLEISECLPLTHGRLLSPSLEIAFLLAEEYCQENNFKILGISECMAFNTKKISNMGRYLHDKLKLVEPNAFLLAMEVTEIDNPDQESEPNYSFFPHLLVANSENADLLKTKVEGGTFREMIKKHDYMFLYDLEEHILDPSIDFSNSQFVFLYRQIVWLFQG